MKEILMTFVIPAYNAESTILRCINSICKDIKEKDSIEILIVENGSNDSTKDIVNKHIEKTPYNIRLLSSEKGVSNARNKGIKEANGELLIFVDADDIWILGSIDKITENYKKQKYDLQMYSFYKGKENIDIDKSKKILYSEMEFFNNDIEKLKCMILAKPTLYMTVWAKVFKKSIITQNNIYFNNLLKFSEDSEFLYRYIKKSKKIKVCKEAIYKYIISEGSTVRTINKHMVDEYCKAIEIIRENITDENEDVQYSFNKFILNQLNIILVNNIFSVKRKERFKNRKKTLQYILRDDIYKASINNIHFYDCINYQLIPEVFIKLKMYNIAGMLYMFKSYLKYKK